MRLLGATPGPGDVTSTLRRLVELFAADRAPTGSILGLWGELWVIGQAADPATLVDAWHSSIDDRFDFSSEGGRLEVKTTTLPQRVHTFNLEQLLPVVGSHTLVGSIMTTSTQAGTSIHDLVGEIGKQLVGDTLRQIRVHEQVAATLGDRWPYLSTQAFDAAQAAHSWRLFRCDDVPRVEVNDAAVIAVHLTVNCGAVVEVYDESFGLNS